MTTTTLGLATLGCNGDRSGNADPPTRSIPGAGADSGSDAAVQSVQVRVENRGDVAIENLRITFPAPTGTVDYGTVEPGESTDYRSADGAYRFAGVQATIAGEPVDIRPVDYISEQPLEDGQYTYALTPNPEGGAGTGRLSQEMVED